MTEHEMDLDDDLGSEPECPYCGSQNKCDHLLAYYDETFGECMGGYAYRKLGSKSDKLEAAFRALLSQGKGTELDWGYEEVEEKLAREWENAVDLYSKDMTFYANSSRIEMALVGDVTARDITVAETDSDGAPGMSANYVTIFAENPKKEFEAGVSCLEEILEDKVRGFLGTGIGEDGG